MGLSFRAIRSGKAKGRSPLAYTAEERTAEAERLLVSQISQLGIEMCQPNQADSVSIMH